jgi:hypothetical protein
MADDGGPVGDGDKEGWVEVGRTVVPPVVYRSNVRTVLSRPSWTGIVFSSLKVTNVRTVSRRWKKALSNTNGQVETGSNMYSASIHCICSGLRKLCRTQEVEAGLILFRGFGNMALPEQFFDTDAQGCRGGVECGLMNTSTDREVAIGYSGVDTGKVLPTVFEIKVGKTSVAADISWLSQFEAERESTFSAH